MGRVPLFVMIVVLISCWHINAKAQTPLEMAVNTYNANAQLLQSTWNAHQLTQSAAFDDWLASHNHLLAYVQSTNDLDMHSEWLSFLDAKEQLTDTSGPIADSAFSSFRAILNSTYQALEQVSTCDENDPLSVAYDTGAIHFSMPSQPVIFWRDPETPPLLGYTEFDLPILAVGDSQSYLSYNIRSLLPVFRSVILPLASAIGACLWIFNHADDAAALNARLSLDFYRLCLACSCGLTAYLISRGYTQQELEEFCETYNDPNDPICQWVGLSDADRAGYVRRISSNKMVSDLQEIDDAAKERIQPGWWPDEWLD